MVVPKAEEYADRVAKYVFTSPIFRDAIEELSVELGNELVDQLNAEVVHAASTGLLCLQEYAGAQYGERLYKRFGDVIKEAMPSDKLTLGPIPTGVGPPIVPGVVILTGISAVIWANVTSYHGEIE